MMSLLFLDIADMTTVVKYTCAHWRILKPPGSLLATDRSKAAVLV